MISRQSCFAVIVVLILCRLVPVNAGEKITVDTQLLDYLLKPQGISLKKGEDIEVIARKSFNDTEYLEVQWGSRFGYVESSKIRPVKEHNVAAGPLNVGEALTPLPMSSDSVNDLGLTVLRASVKEGAGNSIISPYGIWSNARLWLPGADDQSRKNIIECLGFDDATAKTSLEEDVLRSFDLALKSPEISWKEDYAAFLTRWRIENKDSSFSESERQKLNVQVAEWSDGQIEKFFSKDTWDDRASLLFTNVICLDAKWVQPFDRELTRPRAFHVTPEKEIMVPTMALAGKLEFVTAADRRLEGVILPYKDSGLVGIALINSDFNDQTPVLSRLDSASLRRMVPPTPGPKESVTLSLPRFRVEADIDLRDTVNLAPNCVFPNICSKVSSISGMRQKVVLAVDEDGTRRLRQPPPLSEPQVLQAGDC